MKLLRAALLVCAFVVQGYFTFSKFAPSDFAAYYYGAVVIHELLPEELYTANWSLSQVASRGLTIGSPYLYPPFFAVLLSPVLPLFDFHSASLLWWSVNELILAFLILLLIRNDSMASWLITALLVSAPVISVIQFGNIDLFLAVMVFFLFFPPNGVRLGDGASGVIAGLLTAVKPTYATLILYFAIRRQWRSLTLSLITVGITVLIPLVIIGPRAFGEFLGATEIFGKGNAGVINQSLNATISRLLTDAPYYSPADIQPPAAFPLSALAASILLVVTFYTLWKRKMDEHHGLCLVFLMTLLASPITWFAQCVVLIPIVFYIFRRWALTWPTLLGTACIFSWLYLINPFPQLTLPGRLWASHGTWGLLFLAGAVLAQKEGAGRDEQQMGGKVKNEKAES
ncbi:MAG TPA: glycosyltransferase family 87 protein [Bacteroidota bacterium]